MDWNLLSMLNMWKYRFGDWKKSSRRVGVGEGVGVRKKKYMYKKIGKQPEIKRDGAPHFHLAIVGVFCLISNRPSASTFAIDFSCGMLGMDAGGGRREGCPGGILSSFIL